MIVRFIRMLIWFIVQVGLHNIIKFSADLTRLQHTWQKLFQVYLNLTLKFYLSYDESDYLLILFKSV